MDTSTLVVTDLERAHWPQVRAIYAEGIATRNATLETVVPDWPDWDRRFVRTSRLVALERTTPLGWAALSAVSSREVYRGVAEISVYVATSAWGRGVGSLLLDRLIESAERHGVWMLQAGVFPENPASIRLHQKFGFRTVGTRERIGQLDDVWRDVVLLERRSTRVG